MGCAIANGDLQLPGDIFPTYDWMKTQFGTVGPHLRDICDYARTHTDATTINETLSIAEQVHTYFQNL